MACCRHSSGTFSSDSRYCLPYFMSDLGSYSDSSGVWRGFRVIDLRRPDQSQTSRGVAPERARSPASEAVPNFGSSGAPVVRPYAVSRQDSASIALGPKSHGSDEQPRGIRGASVRPFRGSLAARTCAAPSSDEVLSRASQRDRTPRRKLGRRASYFRTSTRKRRTCASESPDFDSYACSFSAS